MSIKRNLENFERALQRLSDYLSTPIKDDRDESGIIQAFEFTFELAWKSLQKKGQQEGLKIASPKSAFQYAIKAGYLLPVEELGALQMLEDRNLTTHAYDQPISHQIFLRISQKHYKLLSVLLERIKKEEIG